MEDELKNYIEIEIKNDSRSFQYLKINDSLSLEKIYNLFINKIMFTPTNDIEYHYLGFYYQHVNIDHEKMLYYYSFTFDRLPESMSNVGDYYYDNRRYNDAIKYYLKAADHNDVYSLLVLGEYYSKIDKDFSQAEKYFLMAFERDNMCNAGYYLGHLYYKAKNYQKMKTYFLKSIENGDCDSMYNLAEYYYGIEHDYPNTIKYYLMAIEKGDSKSMINLAEYYYQIEKDYENMMKYMLMAIENGDIDGKKRLESITKETDKQKLIKIYVTLLKKKLDKNIIRSIIDTTLDYYKNNINNDIFDNTFFDFINIENEFLQNVLPPVFKLVKKIYNEKINLIDLHFNYSLEGKGFDEARDDFNKRIMNIK